jgi:hypothetical protein
MRLATMVFPTNRYCFPQVSGGILAEFEFPIKNPLFMINGQAHEEWRCGITCVWVELFDLISQPI